MRKQKPQPLPDVDAIVKRFEDDLANPDSDIQVLSVDNLEAKAQYERELQQQQRAADRRRFFRTRAR